MEWPQVWGPVWELEAWGRVPLEGLLWWHLSLHKATFVGLGPQSRGTPFPSKKGLVV